MPVKTITFNYIECDHCDVVYRKGGLEPGELDDLEDEHENTGREHLINPGFVGEELGKITSSNNLPEQRWLKYGDFILCPECREDLADQLIKPKLTAEKTK